MTQPTDIDSGATPDKRPHAGPSHPKLGMPMRMLAKPPAPGMVYLAAVRTSAPGHVPAMAHLRSRISAEIATVSIMPADLMAVCDDPLVVTVQVSGTMRVDEGALA